MNAVHSKQLSSVYLLLYAMAWAGGTVAYTPFITVLLPVKITAIAGAEQGIVWTAYISFFGAIAASIGAIFFGYLSDLTKNRPIWIASGILLSCILLLSSGLAKTFFEIISVIILWQLALNMFLAPLAAFAADNVPDEQRGTLGGLLAFAPGIGAFSATIATYPGLASAQGRLLIVCAIVIALAVPLLFVRKSIEEDAKSCQNDGSASSKPLSIAIRMWIARFAVQICEAALFSYLYFWLRSIDPSISDSQTARIFTVTMVISAPVALLIGRWADKYHEPMTSLVICAAFTSLSLLSMAISKDAQTAVLSYGVFGVASSAFLALHTAQTLSVLPKPDRRGRDLGVFNLTNTLPSMILPPITLVLVPRFGFSALFGFLCALAGFGCLVLLSIKGVIRAKN